MIPSAAELRHINLRSGAKSCCKKCQQGRHLAAGGYAHRPRASHIVADYGHIHRVVQLLQNIGQQQRNHKANQPSQYTSLG